MITIEALRKSESIVTTLSDEQVTQLRSLYYELTQLIYEDWQERFRSKFPVGSLTDNEEEHTL